MCLTSFFVIAFFEKFCAALNFDANHFELISQEDYK